MVAPINGYWNNLYNGNNTNNVKVPYRPQEDVVIPFRPADEIEANTDEVKITKHHGAGATVKYSTVDNLSAEAQPYRYTVEKQDSEKTMSVAVGPYVKVSGLTAQSNDIPSNINSDGNPIIGTGVKVETEVSKELPTVDNTEVYGEFDASLGYASAIPSNTSGKTDVRSLEVKHGYYFDYNIGIGAGAQYNINDRNNVRVSAGLNFRGLCGKDTYGDKADINTYNYDGVPQYRTETANNYVFTPNLGAEYNVTTKKGLKVSLGGKVGYGFTNYGTYPNNNGGINAEAGIKLGF